MKKKKIIAAIIIIISISMYITSKVYENYQIIDERQMGNMITYLHLLDCAKYEDEVKAEKLSIILQYFQLTTKQFKKNIKYYNKNLFKLKEAYKYALDEISLLEILD